MEDEDGLVLAWAKYDWEYRLGLTGGRFTSCNHALSLVFALLATVGVYSVAVPTASRFYVSDILVHRGPTQHAVVFLSFAAFWILLVKGNKLRLQKRALNVPILPTNLDFVLSPTTAEHVASEIHRQVDEPERFFLFGRILTALGNLKNLGRVGDVDEILRAQSDHQESVTDTSYSVLQGFIWAIPVLGFIGTVIGLSAAIGDFGKVLGASSDMSQITDSLREVTAGLRTAFDTTLLALVMALVIQLAATFQRKNEQEHLDACSDYCLRRVVNKLRMTPFASEG